MQRSIFIQGRNDSTHTYLSVTVYTVELGRGVSFESLVWASEPEYASRAMKI